jgi:hypothetical protein
LSHIVRIGESNLGEQVVVLAYQCGGKVATQHEVVAAPWTFVPLAKVKTGHWQLAAPERPTMTEVANVHTDPAVRPNDPAINGHFLEG